jgi:hypothetical protein
MGKQEDRTLSGYAAERTVDTRPAFAPVSTPIGEARIRRLQPEQLFTVLSSILPGAGVDPAEITIISWPQQQAVAKLVQICLVGVDSNCLLYHGEQGLRVLCSWPRSALLAVARAAANLMEF